MIICRRRETGEMVTFGKVSEALDYINGDHSEEWLDYTSKDWKEGLREFTDLELVRVVSGVIRVNNGGVK